jgi:hypothetical protein
MASKIISKAPMVTKTVDLPGRIAEPIILRITEKSRCRAIVVPSR